MSKVSDKVSNEMFAKFEFDIKCNLIVLRNIDNRHYATQKILDDTKKMLAKIELVFKKPVKKPNSEIQLYA
jgi:hypothetical protein